MKPTDELIQKVKDNGFPLHIGNYFCDEYQKKHKNNCKGCESEEGCARLALLSFVSVISLLNKTKSFQHLNDKILDRKTTVAELKLMLKENHGHI